MKKKTSTPERSAQVPSKLRKVALEVGKHEAGHWVVARRLGFQTNGIRVKFNYSKEAKEYGYGASTTIVATQDLSTTAEIEDYLERRIQVLYAGSFGQALSVGSDIGTEAGKILVRDGQSDSEKVEIFLELLLSIRFRDASKAISPVDFANTQRADLWMKSAQVVLANAAEIEAVGRALARQVITHGISYELSETDIRSIPVIENWSAIADAN